MVGDFDAIVQNMEIITIRSYKPADLEAIVELWYRTWHETFPHLHHPQPYSAWKQRFEGEFVRDGEIFLAEATYQIGREIDKKDKKIVGFAVLLQHNQILSQLFVDREYQNRGVGTKLLDRAKALSQGRTQTRCIAGKYQSMWILRATWFSNRWIFHQSIQRSAECGIPLETGKDRFVLKSHKLIDFK